MIAQNRRLMLIVFAVILLLSVPLIAMQFTQEVSWSPLDFLAAGGLLLGTGLSCELVLRKVKTKKQRIILCACVLGACLLVWLEFAVGIFGTPFAGS